MAETISPDYLVIGAGAVGMAFVDTLVSDTEATAVIVDSYSRPGGHWTIAYPHVTLHQPSSAYGVNSRELGEGKIDKVGLNKGYAELATGDEIVAYFYRVMHDTFLPSGRVSYYPKHNYIGEGQFQSIITGKVIHVGSRTRIVDCTYAKVKVPAMSPPAYKVSDKVRLITPNALATLKRPHGGYTLVGAGKTALDAGLCLLGYGIDPNDITWIVPRDSWFLERGSVQDQENTPDLDKLMKERADAIVGAKTSDEMFLLMEAYGHVLRIDKDIKPTMFKFATVTKAEIEELKKIKNIVRQGRIISIDPDKVALEQGTYTPVPESLYIDCSASAISNCPAVPVWNGRHITPQLLRIGQPTLSAALIAYLDNNYDDEEFRNSLCEPVPACSKPKDYCAVFLVTLRNQLKWMALPDVDAWCAKSRLYYPFFDPPPPQDSQKAAAWYATHLENLKAVCNKFEELLSKDTAIAHNG
ncbi:pyridine nucleotide-disulfide oxidoreductase-domain-containing protein [Boeremia exigua]|uniref:pyridine nucleotide-disulfide oxidoreductase-domain-containing protein n=1 Tax=Boeremia exigua TaxID=749465 RepID=UPI001E8DA920|nr:pyridine nucleotide-disulfide oxidoreductase-domain-containing protein [Boeremia exigua]KAH6643499.1 pyridine nucleotide-disulfide oxidoreductase-domain-containing protein [Boeremia exigua]